MNRLRRWRNYVISTTVLLLTVVGAEKAADALYDSTKRWLR